MTDISPERIAALLDGVTEGPWKWNEIDPNDPDSGVCEVRSGDLYISTNTLHTENAHFIAAARDLVPALSARVAELEAERATAERAGYLRGLEDGRKVKPLVWEYHPMGWIASPPTGQAYIIEVRIKGRVMFIKGMNPPPKFDDMEAAKAAAQADYEARILDALKGTDE